MRNLLAVLLLPLTPVWGATIFTDGTFNPGDWNTVVAAQGAGVNHVATQQPAGGNPGAYLQFRSDFPPIPTGSQAFYTADLFSMGFVWDPAVDGPIGQILYSFDLLWVESVGFNTSVGHFHRPVLLQDGVRYTLGTSSNSVTTIIPEWTSFNFDSSSAADWLRVGGSGNPDFSAGGGLIEFGFRVSLGSVCSGPVGFTCDAAAATSGLDNLQVQILNPRDPGPSEIPEPGTVALLGAGLSGLLLARRRAAGSRR